MSLIKTFGDEQKTTTSIGLFCKQTFNQPNEIELIYT